MLKIKILLALILISETASYSQYDWNTESMKKNELHRRDSTTWDKKLFEMDLKFFKEHRNSGGIFPVPKYNLVGKKTFIGMGYDGNFDGLVINNKRFLYYSYFYRFYRFEKI